MATLEDWKKAGKIAGEALQYGRTLIKKGVLLKEVADKVEAFIMEKGAVPAFPVNISLNEIAAHYTPERDDKTVFGDDLVKLDVGVCVNGAIGDTALTVDLSGKHAKMIQAVEEARDEAIKIIKPGLQLRKIGEVIEKTIRKHGFVPIKNLSGHGLEEYAIHTNYTIPNYDNEDERVLEKGDYIAIEPFATTGAGFVDEGSKTEIFSLVNPKPVRDPTARDILRGLIPYQTLPVATRYFKIPKFKLDLALRTMDRLGIIKLYPILIEREKKPVAQAEHSVYVDKEPIVLTKV
ncbi:type II methionyl aminopeptidase [Candidatus Woesearchaeota archaeon]|nr:type II methionyl aminopeptidase [Candidatus Woesearchaeota archaeon]